MDLYFIFTFSKMLFMMFRSIENNFKTYKKPFRNLKITKLQKSFEKLESKVIQKANNKVGLMIFLRPVVSAKNPHRWELIIMPAKPMALIMPRSCIDRLISHCDTGNTKLMAKVSSNTLASMRPDININI